MTVIDWIKPMNRQLGFTLIETMIIVTIIGILAVSGSAFTVNWVRQAELNTATASLENAINLARSAAIRNATGVVGDQTSGHLCLSKHVLIVHIGGDEDETGTGTGTESTCSSTSLYNFKISSNITIKTASETDNFNCIAFNNSGQVVNSIVEVVNNSGQVVKVNCTMNSPLTIINAGGSETYAFK